MGRNSGSPESGETVFTPLADVVLITITSPGSTNRSPDSLIPGDWEYREYHIGTLPQHIIQRDPFHQMPDSDLCGAIRSVRSAAETIAEGLNNDNPTWYVEDDVVMEYWESNRIGRDTLDWWTPLCSGRHDTIKLR